jgi:hypothetical protein
MQLRTKPTGFQDRRLAVLHAPAPTPRTQLSRHLRRVLPAPRGQPRRAHTPPASCGLRAHPASFVRTARGAGRAGPGRGPRPQQSRPRGRAPRRSVPARAPRAPRQ